MLLNARLTFVSHTLRMTETRPMPLQLTKLTRRLNVRLTRQHGLIGVDVGSRVIKMAQVERRGSGWRLATIRVIPIAHQRELSARSIEDGLIGESLEGFNAATSGLIGRRAACLLPSGIVEPRSQMLPQADDAELRSMVAEDAAENPDGSALVDVWSDREAWDEEAPMVRVSAVTLPDAVARRCAEDLFAHQLQCEYLDALPFAMARAVSLVDHDMELETVAALDWGHSRPLLTILRNGVPAFTRVLRTCGTVHIEQAVQEAMGATPEESARLLSLIPVAGSNSEGRLPELLSRVAGPEINRLTGQLRRTLLFLQQQHPELFPSRLWMLGGGATIAGIDRLLTRDLELETLVWRLPASQLSPSLRRLRQQPLFAAAVGLSVPV